MKSFKQYSKDIAPFFHIPKGSNSAPAAALIYNVRQLDVPVRDQDTNMYTEQEYKYHQWTDQTDNEDEYKLPSKLHKAQGTHDYSPYATTPDYEALNSYTRNSGSTNRKLFQAHVSGRPTEHGSFVKQMDSALDKHKLKHDMHVYSGVQFDPEVVASHHEHRHVHLPAYTSTSLKKDVAASFAGETRPFDGEYSHHHILHFHLKKGQKGAYVGMNHEGDRNNQLSEHPHEHEYIIPRNTRIHIGEKPTVYNDDMDNKKYHVWDAHVVDHHD